MPIVTLSINRSPMALPTLRGPDSAQGQTREKVRRGQCLSQYLCGKILNGQGGKINSSSHLSLTGPAAGAFAPMGDQGGGTQPKASRKAPPLPAPPAPPRLTEGLKSFHPLEVSFLSKSDLSLFPPEDLFPESRSLEQMRLLTLKVDHPSLRATVSSSDNQTPFLVLPSYLRC